MKRVGSIRPFVAAILLGTASFAPLGIGLRAQTTESTTQALLDKAHALEVRGRMDMAAQTWQQVLLNDPKNVDALAGLARAARMSGNEALAGTYLDRLRAINPNDPNIERIERMGSQQNQAAELQQAGKYAKAGQYAQAMTIYRKVFGNTPPPGDWALAYYETESATDDGRAHAIAGLRALTEKYPSDSRYQIALGRILTYNPQTRAEGRKLLERHPSDPQAVEALRQSLVWDAANPASAADIRAYLAKHNDAQLAQALRNQPKPVPGRALMTPEEIAAGKAARVRSEEEQAAYNALNAKRLDDAELRFKAILANDPQNAQALAGMGYVRMQQSNFGGAISFLEQAKQYGARDTGLDKALEQARFYSVMGDGSVALNENDLPTAEQKYREALTMRPGSPEALEGLGGTLLKAQHPEAAVPVFEQVVKAQPSSTAAWRGLFMAQYGAGNAPGALLTERRIPPGVHARLMKDPDFLRTLASAYSSVGRDADAQRVLRSALELPFPAGARGLQVETQLQYAGLLQQANRLDQAAGLYRQVLTADMTNAQAWQGLVRVEHAMKKDREAAQTLASMPPSIYQIAMRDPGFQTTVASIYQAQNRLDIAQDILEKSVQEQTAAGQKPSTAVMLQLAGIYLSRNDAQRAYPIYRDILTENPDRPDAWKGLLTVLHSSGRDQEALAQIQQIPTSMRAQLESDVEYLQTVGAVYNALGQPREAMVFVNRVQQHYALQHSAPPADIDIQDAWLLFNGGNDAGLYRQLMLLGSRQDLSDEQRRSVQMIWSNWAVRRANQAAATGNIKRSLAILNAAAKAFPDNPGVLRALASGYARAGLPKQAVAIFKAQDMTSASASDYKSAVGAALAAGDTKIAETWLRYGLDQYPKDSEMLTLGAKFEQARGNSNRAADYFRASLAAMPPGDPGAELASELSQPAPVGRIPNATQSQDLASLLASPDSTASGAQDVPAPPPYLPSYTNIYGQAPVQVHSNDSNKVYPGSSSVVPSYMSNPASHRSQPGSSVGTLGNYVPENTAWRSTITGSSLPPTSITGGADIAGAQQSNSLPATEYQRQQITILTEQAEARPPITAAPQQAVYGPYVPFAPPTQNAGYTPSPVAVQLGDSTPHIDPAQREVTDVLPTARYVPNARSARAGRPMTGMSTPPQDVYNTPTQNAQYNAQAQPQPQQPGESYGQQYPQPGVASSGGTTRRRRTTPAPAVTSQPPLTYPGVRQPLSDSGYPSLGPAAPVGTPPTDADLVSKSVPPLRGSYDANAVVPGGPLSPRAQNELELAALEGSYSGWIGGTGYGRYRSGTAGFDRLTDIEAPFEASGVLGKTMRATVIARPVFLNSGVVDSAAFQNQTGGIIPVLGTLPANALTPPPQQFSTGVGGEFQLTTANIGLAVGYTPYQFLVSNVTGRVQWRPLGGHFTLFGDRDSVKDTQLSYAGLRDPGTISAVFQGNIWGGVISTGGGVRVDGGNERAGFYVNFDGANLTGFHVLENRKYEGQMGAYFRVKNWPGYGSLNLGASFFGMHYDHNERGMTYGQGGYFSPNVYFLASVPITFNGYYKTNIHYTINGSVGVQTFQEAQAPYYPLDRPLQTGSGNAVFAQNSNTGVNYAFNSELAYRFADHWYLGGYLYANNTNNYDMVSGGFFVRFLFKPQYPTESYPTGLFPTSGSTFRPLRLP
ncbi:cellulose synthase subunit BcsC-related outer membrane protein [Edaphobacter bradus]|uniref:cellulose synthase subunit BcsC-related outer membrane protein n=1 Tax=Edaphobacter bradus TaxID=2259016 RepID=UPI0021E0B529|nr:cellulose synthase subunit BcsC-related outer membrane protein [Edaphobacter bradus]